HRLLQFEQGENLRHQLEDDGLAFETAAQLSNGACEHARMVAEHRMCQPWHQPSDRPGVLDGWRAAPCETRLAQELVALEHLLLVPACPVAAKRNAQAPAALHTIAIRVICTIIANRGPGLETGFDHLAQALGFALPPVLPRE